MSEKIHMPEELRESFEDYYEGVSDTIDRRSAQWGFECGVLHGESTTSHDYQRVIELIKSTASGVPQVNSAWLLAEILKAEAGE